MYNINIELKHHIIYNELRRLRNTYKGYREPAELADFANELYCSELLQVFHSEEILDEKMIKEFEKLLDRMKSYQGTKLPDITSIPQTVGTDIKIDFDSLPDNYPIEEMKKGSYQKIEVQVNILDRDEYIRGRWIKDQKTLFVNIAGHKPIKNTRQYEEVVSFLDAVIEHELMHAIQSAVTEVIIKSNLLP